MELSEELQHSPLCVCVCVCRYSCSGMRTSVRGPESPRLLRGEVPRATAQEAVKTSVKPSASPLDSVLRHGIEPVSPLNGTVSKMLSRITGRSIADEARERKGSRNSKGKGKLEKPQAFKALLTSSWGNGVKKTPPSCVNFSKPQLHNRAGLTEGSLFLVFLDLLYLSLVDVLSGQFRYASTLPQ